MTGGTCQHSTSNRLRQHGFIIQILNHYLVFQVDFIIIFGMAAILSLLTVPAHHYKQRLLNCRNTRQNRIKQKKRVRIKRPCCRHDIDNHSQDQNLAERKYKCPVSGKFCIEILRTLSDCILCLPPSGCTDILYCLTAFITSSSVISRRISFRVSLNRFYSFHNNCFSLIHF